MFFKNVRIAEGGADPYKTLTTDGKFIARGINFDVNKATIKPESMGTLNTIVSILKEHPELTFEIGGHTDNVGTDAYNQRLSEQRAMSIYEVVSKVIAPERLSFKGYGASQPIVPNDSEENRALNRRSEVRITYKPQ